MRVLAVPILFCLILSGCISPNASDWTESTAFNSENRSMIGTEGKVGILGMDFKAGKANKYMWHFWGTEDQLSGSFKVTATKENSKEENEIFSAIQLGGPNNGADAHAPSSLMLPDPGLWRLNAYVNDDLFASVFVNVKDH